MASITSQHVCMTLLEILGVIRENVSRWYRIGLPRRETQETQVRSLGREDSLRRKWQPTPVFWPGKFHGQRSLVSYSPWGHRVAQITEWLGTHITFQGRWLWDSGFNYFLYLIRRNYSLLVYVLSETRGLGQLIYQLTFLHKSAILFIGKVQIHLKRSCIWKQDTTWE